MEGRGLRVQVMARILVAFVASGSCSEALASTRRRGLPVQLPLVHLNAFSAARAHGNDGGRCDSEWWQSAGRAGLAEPCTQGGAEVATVARDKGQDRLAVQRVHAWPQEILLERGQQVPDGHGKDRPSYRRGRARSGENFRHGEAGHTHGHNGRGWRQPASNSSRVHVGSHEIHLGTGRWSTPSGGDEAGKTGPRSACSRAQAVVTRCSTASCTPWCCHATGTTAGSGRTDDGPTTATTAEPGCSSTPGPFRGYRCDTDYGNSGTGSTLTGRPWWTGPFPLRALQRLSRRCNEWERCSLYQCEPRGQSKKSSSLPVAAKEASESPDQTGNGDCGTTKLEWQTGQSQGGCIDSGGNAAGGASSGPGWGSPARSSRPSGSLYDSDYARSPASWWTVDM